MDTFIVITLAAITTAFGMAAFAWWRTRGSSARLGDGPPGLRNLSWEDYSVLIREHFITQGYVVREHPTGGADFELERRGRRMLVNCGHWRSSKVGEQAVHEFFQVVSERDAEGGVMITAGRFTAGARRTAANRHIDLIDGARLRQLVDTARAEDGELTAPRPAGDDESTAPRRVVLCPLCGRAMVKRFERTDGESRAYYGCVRAPGCKGRREIA